MGWEQRAITHRQFVTWLSWHEQQKNEPTSTDYYLMRIAQEVYYARPQWLLQRLPDRENLDKDFKYYFYKKINVELSLEDQVAISKDAWGIIAGQPALPPPEV